MELECEKQQVVKVEYRELERFIKCVYGHEHEIVAAEEAHNDMTLTFKGIGMHPEDYDEFERKAFKKWLDLGEFWPWGTRNILEELCLGGYIEAGDYYVEVWW